MYLPKCTVYTYVKKKLIVYKKMYFFSMHIIKKPQNMQNVFDIKKSINDNINITMLLHYCGFFCLH